MDYSKILLVGEPMCLFRSNEEGVPLFQVSQYSTGIAGAELNVAIGLTRLGHQGHLCHQSGKRPLCHRRFTAGTNGHQYSLFLFF